MQNLKNRTITNILLEFLSNVTSKSGALIFTILIARTLTPELFGIYSLALTITLISATLTDLGISTAIKRYIPHSLGRNLDKRAREEMWLLLKSRTILLILISTTLFLLSEQISTTIFNKPLLSTPLKIGSLYILTFSLFDLTRTLFYCIKRVDYKAKADLIFELSRITTLIILFKLLKPSVELIFLTLIISQTTVSTFLWIIIFKKYKWLIIGPREQLNNKHKKEILNFITWSSLTTMSLLIYSKIDAVMLGFLTPSQFLGFYNTIFTTIITITFFMNFSNVLIPVFSQINKEKLEPSLQKVFYYTYSLVLPAAIGTMFLITPTIKIMYGNEYTPQKYVQTITITAITLSLLIISEPLSAIYNSILNSEERAKTLAYTTMITSILNIILNYFLITYFKNTLGEEYSIIGAAIATTISRHTRFLMWGKAINKKLKIMISNKKTKLLKPVISTIVMSLAIITIQQLISNNLLKYSLTPIIGVITYFTTLILIKGLTKQDVKEITNVLKQNMKLKIL